MSRSNRSQGTLKGAWRLVGPLSVLFVLGATLGLSQDGRRFGVRAQPPRSLRFRQPSQTDLHEPGRGVPPALRHEPDGPSGGKKSLQAGDHQPACQPDRRRRIDRLIQRGGIRVADANRSMAVLHQQRRFMVQRPEGKLEDLLTVHHYDF